jgi:hypothetical protein
LLVGVLAKRHYGCRLVYDAHEFYPVSDPHDRVDITFFSLIERLMIRQADAVVTVNPPLGEAMRAAYRLEAVSIRCRTPSPGSTGGHRRTPNARWRDWPAGGSSSCSRGASPRGGDRRVDRGLGRGRRSPRRLFLRGPDNRWREKAIELAARLGLHDRSVYFLDAVTEGELVTAAAAEADVGHSGTSLDH